MKFNTDQNTLEEIEFIKGNPVPSHSDHLISETLNDYELKFNLSGNLAEYKYKF